MNFNNNQILIVEKLIDDRIHFLKENIFYCQNDIEHYSTLQSSKTQEKTEKLINQQIAEAVKEKNNLLDLKNNILKNKESTECI